MVGFNRFSTRLFLFGGLGLLLVAAFKYDEINKDDGIKMIMPVYASYYHSGEDEGPEKGGRWYYNVFVPEHMAGTSMLELECSLTLQQYNDVITSPKPLRGDERAYALVNVYIGAMFNEIHCEHLHASSEFSDARLDKLAEEGDPTDRNKVMYRYTFGNQE